MQRNLCRWYNQNLSSSKPDRYFCMAYDSILNLGEGIMGLLEVPELGLCIPIPHGTDGEAGHDLNSPIPIGGGENYTVLHLDEVYLWEEGMAVWVWIPRQRLWYRVEMLILVFDRGNTRTIIRCRSVYEPIYTFQLSANL